MIALLTIALRHERDAVSGRRAARHVARLLGFEHQDQIRITTAVSELIRAAMGADAGGDASAGFLVDDSSPQRLVIRVSGRRLREDARGGHSEATAAALLAARRLLERFDGCGDTTEDTVTLARALPPDAPLVTAEVADAIRAEIEGIDAAEAGEYLTELKQQNRELSSTLLELERKQQELTRLNAELADTNRGVMALYAELDERANHLRQADELKTKFLSYMSHEFRTPLNSILALSNMLLDQVDGELTDEQTKQVELIRGSSAELFDLVSDLLDLAKVEAGKAVLNVGRFSVDSLFGALRGMLRPLLRSPSVTLEFDAAPDLPPILGDEAKVAQVLRNFLSNALKFTESGSVHVSAKPLRRGEWVAGRGHSAAQDSVVFCVSDTGIGISRADQELIFDEYTQVRHSLQRGVRGTGLGLPLCLKFASLMGGEVWVESELGRGSRFYLLVPRFYRRAVEPSADEPGRIVEHQAGRQGLPLLVMSDVEAHRTALEELFAGSAFAVATVGDGDVSPELLSALKPRAVIAVVSAGVDRPAALERLRQAGIPLIEVAADHAAQPGGGAREHFDRRVVRDAYREVLRAELGRVLVVDDDAAFQRILTRVLEPYCGQAVAMDDPRSAIEAAAAGGVDCAVLDLMMPDMDGFTLLSLLRENAATERLPVLVCSSRTPSADEWSLLRELHAAFVPKSELEPELLARGLVEACLRAPEAAHDDARDDRRGRTDAG